MDLPSAGLSAYAPNNSLEYVALLKVLAGALHGDPVGDSVDVLGDFNVVMMEISGGAWLGGTASPI